MPHRLAAYTSYTAQRFETTRHFYESILGCTAVNQWDREDGRGVYYDLEASSDPCPSVVCLNELSEAQHARRKLH
jgi:catechol 2,3-dioxygenase-like lactoylglutathione lyase family enzyme